MTLELLDTQLGEKKVGGLCVCVYKLYKLYICYTCYAAAHLHLHLNPFVLHIVLT